MLGNSKLCILQELSGKSLRAPGGKHNSSSKSPQTSKDSSQIENETDQPRIPIRVTTLCITKQVHPRRDPRQSIKPMHFCSVLTRSLPYKSRISCIASVYTSSNSSFIRHINMSTHATNAEAQSFKSLHVPGRPLLLANIHDPSSARTVAALPSCKALATASYSVALSNKTDDDNLDLETQLTAVRDIAVIARQTGKPLTVDLQDGYGERLEEAVRGMIALGVVGINLEDSDQKTHAILDEVVAVQRIKRALAAAAGVGVPDFVVNARSDSLFRGHPLDEAIRRGKLYLEAGATTVFVVNGP